MRLVRNNTNSGAKIRVHLRHNINILYLAFIIRNLFYDYLKTVYLEVK